MNNKTLAVALFAAVMTVTIGMQPVYAQTATGTATVEPKTCGLVFNQGSVVSYGNIINGAYSLGNSHNLTLNNTGNTAGYSGISGNDWKEQGNSTNTVMGSNATHVDLSPILTSVDYNAADQINGALLQVIPQGTTLEVYFGLLLGLFDPLFTGSIEQSMTFTIECL